MLDFLSFIIFFSFLGFLVLVIWLGIKLFSNIVNAGQSSSSYSEEYTKQLRQNSIEDSQGDGLFIANDDSEDLFPEEFDDDDY